MRTAFILLLFFSFVAESQTFLGRQPNTGQLPSDVLFFQRSGSNSLSFTRDSMRFSYGIEVQLENISPQAVPSLADPLPASYNYILGKDQSNWVTNAKQYSTVRLPSAYPGINASWIGGLGGGLERLTFNLTPGTGPDAIRIRFKNAGNMLVIGQTVIWFTGGAISGVFVVNIAASQGSPDIPLTAILNIANADTLTISAQNLDLTRPTQFVISFPNFQTFPVFERSTRSSDGNRYQVDNLADPYSTGSRDAVIARFSEDGTPIWVTILGGSSSDFASNFTPIADGLAISGLTHSNDFPVSSNAPATELQGQRAAYFAFLNRDSGLIRNSTYAPLASNSGTNFFLPTSNAEIVIAGATANPDPPMPETDSGFLLRWRPLDNTFIYGFTFAGPVRTINITASGLTIYAIYSETSPTPRLRIASINEVGSPVGTPVEIPLQHMQNIILLPAPNQSIFAFISVQDRQPNGYSQPFANLAHFSLLNGSTIFFRPLGSLYLPSLFDLSPSGELRLLAFPPVPVSLPTSTNATLVAPCADSLYFARFSTVGALLYASYVPFSFRLETPELSAPPPSLSCFAATAGRIPLRSLVPGQMITLTGANFGPSQVVNSTLGPDGQFPTTLLGYSVNIGSFKAPIFAIARGLIAVQVPFEIRDRTEISISGPGAPPEILPANVANRAFTLFDTGDADNPTRLPALAALNQDGTVNTRSNPASLGSIVSVFGSGLDLPTALRTTGGLHPLDVIYTSPLISRGRNCAAVYIGSAPGLSNAVFQANLRLTTSDQSTGTRPLPISFAVGDNPRSIFPPIPTSIVWVKD